MDFGLAQLADRSRITKAHTTLGTVSYMSPEQAQDMNVDRRADYWALGCVLYEMVTGQRPFLGDFDQAILYSVLNEAPKPPTSLRTGVPMELEAVVDKCLQKERDSRYQSAGEIAVDLGNLAKKLDSGFTRTVPAATAVSIPTPASPRPQRAA
jgi:serine/threonine protein kinase